MAFILLVVVAVGLYVWGYKVPALVIFFFFITSGFNMVPEEVLTNAFFSKGMDYALLIICSIVMIDSFCIKDYLKPDKLLWTILIYYVFLVICVFYNRSSVGTSWIEIIRTARYNVLWIAYLVFRNLSKEQLYTLLKCLFWVTTICSVLFILQIILNQRILNEFNKASFVLLGVKLPRFYNQPDMLQIFTFMAIYYNPYKGKIKVITGAILLIAFFGAFHRSLFIGFIVAVSVGYILRLSRVKRIVAVSVLAFSVLFIASFGHVLTKSRTAIDIGIVMSGDLANSDLDMDADVLSESTFSFRIAHLLERNQYLLEHPKAMLFGAGWMTEESKLTSSMFDFDIGLIEDRFDVTNQLDTSDISYSLLLMRYGYLGTLLNLVLYGFLMVFFYKNRQNPFGFFSFLYFIVVVVTTFFSWTLILPITFLLPLIVYSLIQKNKVVDDIVT